MTRSSRLPTSSRSWARRGATVVLAGSAVVGLGAWPSVAAAGSVGAAGGGDPYFPAQGNGGYDVGHYDLALDATDPEGALAGVATIAATATQPLARFDLDLRRDLTVSAVTVDGAAAAFAQPADQPQELVVTPARALRSGAAFTVVVRYAGTPRAVTDPDGSIEGWVATGDGAFVVGEPQGSPGWFPANDSPQDKATFDVQVTVPAGRTAVSNGDLVGTDAGPGGATTFHWRQSRPMSTYLATASSGRFQVSTGTTPGGVPWYTAVDPTQAAASQATLAQLPAMVDFFSSVFGRYPWTSTGALVDDAPQVGYALETTTRPSFDSAPDELTLAHELAHQWYGDSVTLARWRDIWLNEGFAEWASWYWSEHAGQKTAQQFFDERYATPADDASFWTPPPADPGSGEGIFASSVYERGAMTLQALRTKLGDPVFLGLLRDWAATHAYGNARVEDFVAFAEARAPRAADLPRFFDVWLYQPAKPTTW